MEKEAWLIWEELWEEKEYDQNIFHEKQSFTLKYFENLLYYT